MSALTFPRVSGRNLLRQNVTFPDDLPGKLNLLLLAFYQRQQLDINTWIPLSQQLEAAYNGLYYYELPTITLLGRFQRFFINEGMRAGIPDTKARERTLTLYLDKDEFLSALEIPSQEEIQVLLVDQAGAVLWRTAGRLDETKEAALREFIASQLAPNPDDA